MVEAACRHIRLVRGVGVGGALGSGGEEEPDNQNLESIHMRSGSLRFCSDSERPEAVTGQR